MTDAPLILSEEAEYAWEEMFRVEQWSAGFWLAFLFADHTPTLDALARRFCTSRPARVVRPRDAGTDAAVVEAVLEALASGHRVWLQTTPPPDGVDRERWFVGLFSRLNERRESIIEASTGFVITAPIALSNRVSSLAPDLWSVRNLAFTLPTKQVLTIDPQRAAGYRERAEERRQTGDSAGAAHWGKLVAAVTLEPTVVPSGEEDCDSQGPVQPQRPLDDWPGFIEEYQLVGDLLDATDLVEATERAQSLLERAIERRRRLGDRDDVLQQLGHAWWLEALVAYRRGDLGGAVAAMREALEIFRMQWQAHPNHIDSLMSFVLASGQVADFARERGDRVEAHDALSAALRAIEDAALTETIQAKFARIQMMLLSSLGTLLVEMGEFVAAIRVIEQALSSLDEVAEDAPRDREATLRDVLGKACIDIGEFDRARKSLAQSLELRKERQRLEGDTPDALRAISIGRTALGELELKAGDAALASNHFAEAVRLDRLILSVRHNHPQAIADLVGDLKWLARSREAEGRAEEAQELLAEARALEAQLEAT